MSRKNNPLANKTWQPLPTGKVTFDQTSGALAAVDKVDSEDRGAHQRAEGAIISGMVSVGL